MKEFNEKHIKDLQEADGFVLQDVKGKTVAIGIDLEYSDVASFLVDYINEYGLLILAHKLGYEDSRKMLNDLITRTICLNFPIAHIETKLMGVFNGISADDYAKKLEERQWHLGDIVEDGKGHKAMIILDDNFVYKLMNIKDKGAFITFDYFAASGTLNGLQDGNPEWHKVVEE